MEYSHKCLRAKKSMVLNDQKQVENLNKIKNISTEEILYGLQMKDHSLQPSALDIICKMSTRRKRASSISKENTQCKGIKLSDEIKKKSVCTMSKKEESLLGKIKHMIGEQMDILNSDFINQKLESLNRRVEQLQCKDNHEEIAKALLKKVSKLERRIDAVIAFQEESLSKMAVHQYNFASNVSSPSNLGQTFYTSDQLDYLGH
ncbi:hypothetical protein Q9233_004611 [Columba guinea]|nr:hypothetical protein Q9233_004611 [Columba guinea]